MIELRHFGLTLLTSIHASSYSAGGTYPMARADGGCEPVDPFERREFDAIDVPPWPFVTNDFSLVETVDGLGEGVVVRVADASD